MQVFILMGAQFDAHEECYISPFTIIQITLQPIIVAAPKPGYLIIKRMYNYVLSEQQQLLAERDITLNMVPGTISKEF